MITFTAHTAAPAPPPIESIDLHFNKAEAERTLTVLGDVTEGPLFEVRRALHEALTGDVLPLIPRLAAEEPDTHWTDLPETGPCPARYHEEPCAYLAGHAGDHQTMYTNKYFDK